MRTLLKIVPVLAVCTMASCNSSNAISSISGSVEVDGRVAEVGTISLKPFDNPGARGAGGAINSGVFEIKPTESLKPGRYLVAVEVSKATGRTFQDPQRGAVPVLQVLEIVDSPQEVDVNSENYHGLKLSFTTRK